MTDTLEQLKALAELREKAKISEPLFVTYEEPPCLDDLKLNAFLIHGQWDDLEDDAEIVCVDEDPHDRDGPPSPRLEYLAAAGSLDFAAIAQELERLRAKVEDLTEHNAQLQSLEVLRQMADNAGCNPPETE